MRRMMLVLVLPLVSCATMTTGRYEKISVTSSPDQATAALSCERGHTDQGTTPIVFTIRRNAGNCNVTVRKDGFEEQTVLIEQGVNPMYWGNMIFAPVGPAGVYVVMLGDSQESPIGVGLIGAAVVIFATDFYTGAVHTHRPQKVDVVLKPKTQ